MCLSVNWLIQYYLSFYAEELLYLESASLHSRNASITLTRVITQFENHWSKLAVFSPYSSTFPLLALQYLLFISLLFFFRPCALLSSLPSCLHWHHHRFAIWPSEKRPAAISTSGEPAKTGPHFLLQICALGPHHSPSPGLKSQAPINSLHSQVSLSSVRHCWIVLSLIHRTIMPRNPVRRDLAARVPRLCVCVWG